MDTWKEIDQAFQLLAESCSAANLQIQWGAVGEIFSFSGPISAHDKQRFNALSRIAGEKLTKVLQGENEIHAEILAEKDSCLRWYRALWKLSPAFKTDLIAFQKSDSGEDKGTIFCGTLSNPASASAALAVDMLSRYREPTKPEKVDEKRNLYDKFANWYRGNPYILALTALIFFVSGAITFINQGADFFERWKPHEKLVELNMSILHGNRDEMEVLVNNEGTADTSINAAEIEFRRNDGQNNASVSWDILDVNPKRFTLEHGKSQVFNLKAVEDSRLPMMPMPNAAKASVDFLKEKNCTLKILYKGPQDTQLSITRDYYCF